MCLPAYTDTALAGVEISVADRLTPVQAGQGPGPVHGAVVGDCDSKRAGEKGINVGNEPLRAVYFVQAAEDDIWDLQGAGTLVLQSPPALEAF